MRRVYAIYFLRKATGRTALKVYAMLALGFTEIFLVSPFSIINNFFQVAIGPRSAFWFTVSAVSKTESLNLLILLAVLATAVFLARDFIASSNKQAGLFKIKA